MCHTGIWIVSARQEGRVTRSVSIKWLAVPPCVFSVCLRAFFLVSSATASASASASAAAAANALHLRPFFVCTRVTFCCHVFAATHGSMEGLMIEEMEASRRKRRRTARTSLTQVLQVREKAHTRQPLHSPHCANLYLCEHRPLEQNAICNVSVLGKKKKCQMLLHCCHSSRVK